MKKVTWQNELAGELETVIKGGQFEVPEVTIENIVNDLHSGEVDEIQIATRLRNAGLGWFAQRLDSRVFHDRETGETTDEKTT